MDTQQHIDHLREALNLSLKAIEVLVKLRSKIDDEYEPWETADYFNILDDMIAGANASNQNIAEHLRKVVAGEVIE